MYLSWLCVEHKCFEEGEGMHLPKCTFHAWYEIEIRFSDNLQQKETIDDIILAQENKVCNLLIRYHF